MRENRLSLDPGRSLIVEFDAFRVRLDLRTSETLRLTVLDGDDAGFEDDVVYGLRWLRPDLAVLSWQERIGTTVTHVIDLPASRTYATVAPAKGGFLRLEGRLATSPLPD